MDAYCIVYLYRAYMYVYIYIYKSYRSLVFFEFHSAINFSSNWHRKDQVCFSSQFLSLSGFFFLHVCVSQDSFHFKADRK